MQWAAGKNLGFSSAPPQALYLPVDSAADAPTVESEEKDSASLYHTVKEILKFRQTHDELDGRPNLEILYAEKGKLPFVYQRGSLVLAVNPGSRQVSAPVKTKTPGRPLYAVGQGRLENGTCTLEGQSFVIFGT
jgi:maltose alpha-D-glucosyltransferase/alpha-amylase